MDDLLSEPVAVVAGTARGIGRNSSVTAGNSSLFDEVEAQPARALARAGALAACEPQERRAVDPAGVLELPHDA